MMEHGQKNNINSTSINNYLPLLILLCLCLVSSLPTYATIFSGEVVPVSTPGIRSVVIMDLNKDGFADLLSTSENNNSLSVALGDGNGGFSIPVDYPVGSLPQQLRIVDVNKDTNLDVVVVNQGSNTVSVLLGDGTGGLGAKTDFAAGSIPVSVAVDDLNKDGNIDIVIANVTTDLLSVLFGDGTGNFAAAITIPAGDGPRSVEISDVNNDTNLDIVVANRDGGDVMIFSGDGTGGFLTPVSFNVGINLKDIILADLNSNGLQDMLITKTFFNGFSVLLATGGGNYGLPSNHAISSNVGSLSVDDINDDGFQDVVIGASRISLMTGDGSGLLNPPTELFDVLSSFIISGNINSDSTTDIVFATSDGLVSMIGKGGGIFTEQLTGISQPEMVIQGDFNSDGNLDVIGANKIASSSTQVFLADSAGDLSLFDIHAFPGLINSLIAKDINRDGILDLVGVGKSQNQVYYSVGNDNGSFTNTSNFLVGNSPDQIVSGDVNRDANPDLVVTNTLDSTISILLGNGRGGFSNDGTFATGMQPTKLVLADFNEDGNLDVITTNSGGNNISILLGSPTGVFSAPSNIGVGSFPNAIVASDFNKNGHVDLAIANTNSQNITILIGDGTGGIASTQLISIASSPSSLSTSDINADGNVDLVAGDGTNGSVILFRGDGAGAFSAATNYFVGGNNTAFIVADIDKDARSDLVVAEKDGNKLVLLRNIESRPGAANDNIKTLQDTIAITPNVLLNDIDNEATGSLTLNGVDINSIQGGTVVDNFDNTFNYTPAAGFLGQDSFNYNIIDGDGNTATGNVVIEVTLTNQLPIPTASDIVIIEDTSGNSQINVDDSDLGDTFTFVISSNPISGFATVSNIGLVTYTPSSNFNGADALTVQVTDSNSGSNTMVINITVQPTNDPPTATASDIITNEDTTGSSQVNVTDPDVGDSFTYSISGVSANGFASVDNNGLVNFSPTTNFNGADFISVRVTDLAGASDFVTINVTVNASNDTPAPTVPNIIILEDTSGSSQIQPNDPDVGDTATFALKTPANNGSASVNATGLVSYTPNADFNGTDSVIVTVTDTLGLFADVSVPITVTNVNDPPVPTASFISTNEDTIGSGQILVNDPDVGDSFTYSISGVPANGLASVDNNGLVNFSPTTNFNGADFINVRVTDLAGASGFVTINVTVNASNDTPAPTVPNIIILEDTSGSSQIQPNDPDVGDTATFALKTPANNGSASVNATGLVSYTPNADFNGTDSVIVTVTDTLGLFADVSVPITVTNVNDPPVPTASFISTSEDTIGSGQILANDPDPGDSFQYTLATLPANGIVFIASDGQMSYVPNANYSGSDTFIVNVTDNEDETAVVVVDVNVLPVNDPPSISAQVINTTEEQSATTQVIITDPDAGDTFTFAIVTQPNLGSAEVDSNGFVTYTPAAQFSGSEFFAVQVDDSGGASVMITIGATVSSVNDAPTASAANISTISGGTATTLIIVNDPDKGDTFTYAISTPPEHGEANVSVNGLVSFTADSDFSGSDSITIMITDSAGANGTIAIGIQINSVPTATPAPTSAQVASTSGGGSINFWFITGLLLIFWIRMWRIKAFK